jgi:TetR/AcrR family fatty acid metabolism transcriptional regulator
MSPSRTAVAPSATSQRRAELIAAAVRVIARRGYAETRFQDVAVEAGVAVGTLQHHFGTRRRMLTEALDAWIDEADEQFVGLKTGVGDPWQRLQVLLLYHGTRLGERVDAWRMWLDFTTAAIKDDELRGSTARSMERWRGALSDIIDQGVHDGVFDPVLAAADVADALAAFLDGTALQVYGMDSDMSGSEINDRLLRVAEALVRPVGH